MKFENLVPIVYQGIRVLTGNQIAELYGTNQRRIKDNFNSSKKHFKEGEHYFKVTGTDLFELKERVNGEVAKMLMRREGDGNSYPLSPTATNKRGEVAENFGSFTPASPLSTYTNSAILYTAKGAARHCKMLSTPKAWEVFGKLERAYFEQDEPVEQGVLLLAPAEPVVETNTNNNFQTELNALRMENNLLKNQLTKIACLEFAMVYVLLMSNGSVKIGMTKDLTERIKQIKAETGLDVFNARSTPSIPRDEARRLEKILLDKYADLNLGGEFFAARFDDVVADIKALCA